MTKSNFDINYEQFLNKILSDTGYRAEIDYNSNGVSISCIITFYKGKETDKKVVFQQTMLLDRFNEGSDLLERTILITLSHTLTDFIKNNMY
jgi:hypothetical protein